MDIMLWWTFNCLFLCLSEFVCLFCYSLSTFRQRQECPCAEECGGGLRHSLPLAPHTQLLPQLRHDGQLLHFHRAAFETGHPQDGHCIHERSQLVELPEILPWGKGKVSLLVALWLLSGSLYSHFWTKNEAAVNTKGKGCTRVYQWTVDCRSKFLR